MSIVKTLHVVRKSGMWVFTDLSVRLVDEPFVMGADTLLDVLVEKFKDDAWQNGVNLSFSTEQFDGYQVKLIRDPIENRLGNWYTYGPGLRAWLCPALYCYFAKAPMEIYAAVEPHVVDCD